MHAPDLPHLALPPCTRPRPLQMVCMPPPLPATMMLSTAPLAPPWHPGAAPPWAQALRQSGLQRSRRATGRRCSQTYAAGRRCVRLLLLLLRPGRCLGCLLIPPRASCVVPDHLEFLCPPPFHSSLWVQAQQLDYLQEQARAGQLEPGWPIYRSTDKLYTYLTGKRQRLYVCAGWGVWCEGARLAVGTAVFVCLFVLKKTSNGTPILCSRSGGGEGEQWSARLALPWHTCAVWCRYSWLSSHTHEPTSIFPSNPTSAPLAENPPQLADLVWPRAKASQEAQRWHQLPLAQQQQQQQAEAEAAGGQQAAARAVHDQQLEEPETLLALLQRRGGPLPSDSKAVTEWAARPERAVVRTRPPPAPTSDTAPTAPLERWLRRATEPGCGAAMVLAASLAAQRQVLVAPQPAPRPRLYGPPPPDNVGAAVRHTLFKRQYADQVMKRLLVGIAERLVSEGAARRRSSGGGRPDDRHRRDTHARGR